MAKTKAKRHQRSRRREGVASQRPSRLGVVERLESRELLSDFQPVQVGVYWLTAGQATVVRFDGAGQCLGATGPDAREHVDCAIGDVGPDRVVIQFNRNIDRRSFNAATDVTVAGDLDATDPFRVTNGSARRRVMSLNTAGDLSTDADASLTLGLRDIKAKGKSGPLLDPWSMTVNVSSEQGGGNDPGGNDPGGNDPGGNDPGGNDPGNPDVTAPAVLSTTPALGATLTQSPSFIESLLSEDLDPAHLPGPNSFQLHAAGPDNNLGTADDVRITPTRVDYSAATDRLSFVVNGQLANGSYRARLVGDGSIRDAAGNQMAEHAWTFRVETPTTGDTSGPKVTSVTPPVGVPLTEPVSSISVTFDEDIDAATVTNPENFQLFASGGDQTFGDGNERRIQPLGISYDSPARTAVMTIGGALGNDAYQVQLIGTGSVRDQSGNRLDGNGDGVSGDDFVAVLHVTVPAPANPIAGPHKDPSGGDPPDAISDTFGAGSPPLDISFISAFADPASAGDRNLFINVRFNTVPPAGRPIEAPSAHQPNSVFGFIDIDVDPTLVATATTGLDANPVVPGAQFDRTPNTPGFVLGVDYGVDIGSEARHPGLVDVFYTGPKIALVGDTDFNRLDDLVIYRPLTGEFLIGPNIGGEVDSTLGPFVFGGPDEVPLLGDWDPDGSLGPLRSDSDKDFGTFIPQTLIDPVTGAVFNFRLDLNGDHRPGEDRNGNLVLDPSEDLNNNFRLDLSLNEDRNRNGVLDAGEDVNGNNLLDLSINEDTNGNGVLDLAEDLANFGVLDTETLYFGFLNDSGEPDPDPADRPVIGDWDGDGDDDLGVYRIGTGMFLLDLNGNYTFDAGEDLNGDGLLQASEDLNCNGLLDTGEDLNGNSVLDVNEDVNCNRRLDSERFVFGPFGASYLDNEVVVGDWNRSGEDKIGIFVRGERDVNGDGVLDPEEDLNGNDQRDTTAGLWFLDADGDHKLDPDEDVIDNDQLDCGRDGDCGTGDQGDEDLDRDGVLDNDGPFTFGGAQDTPIVGDWVTPGRDELGVRRFDTNLFFLDLTTEDRNGNNILDCGLDLICGTGDFGDEDIDRDGRLDFGDHSIGTEDGPFTFGRVGDIPIAGSFGPSDSRSDIGIFRPTIVQGNALVGDLFLIDSNSTHSVSPLEGPFYVVPQAPIEFLTESFTVKVPLRFLSNDDGDLNIAATVGPFAAFSDEAPCPVPSGACPSQAPSGTVTPLQVTFVNFLDATGSDIRYSTPFSSPRLQSTIAIPNTTVIAGTAGVEVTLNGGDASLTTLLDPRSIHAGTVRLTGSGGDDTFDDGNDTRIVANRIVVGSKLRANDTVFFDLTGVTLRPDLYRFELLGDDPVRDFHGVPLDGEVIDRIADGRVTVADLPSGNGIPQGDFVATFRLDAPPEIVSFRLTRPDDQNVDPLGTPPGDTGVIGDGGTNQRRPNFVGVVADDRLPIIGDPPTDTFPGTAGPDLFEGAAEFDLNTACDGAPLPGCLHIGLRFTEPVALQSSGEPLSLAGFIDIDTDQVASTGATGWIRDLNGDRTQDFSDGLVTLGRNGDVPIVGSWVALAGSRLGIYRPSTGEFFLDLDGDGRFDQDEDLDGNGVLDAGEDVDGDGKLDVSEGPFASGVVSEDLDGDGILDPGEDVDGNGVLDIATPVVGDFCVDNTLTVAVECPGVEVGVFRNGEWTIDLNGDRVFGPGETFAYGSVTDLPVVGNWNGDALGKDEIGVFTAATGNREPRWQLDSDGDFVPDDIVIEFGEPGNTVQRPVVGRWTTSTRQTKLGTYNPLTSEWRLDLNGNAKLEATEGPFVFGDARSRPVIGDWDGDSDDDIGTFNVNPTGVTSQGRTQWFIDADGSRTLTTGDGPFLFGIGSEDVNANGVLDPGEDTNNNEILDPTDVPVVGMWEVDGVPDGEDTFGVFRPRDATHQTAFGRGGRVDVGLEYSIDLGAEANGTVPLADATTSAVVGRVRIQRFPDARTLVVDVPLDLIQDPDGQVTFSTIIGTSNFFSDEFAVRPRLRSAESLRVDFASSQTGFGGCRGSDRIFNDGSRFTRGFGTFTYSVPEDLPETTLVCLPNEILARANDTFELANPTPGGSTVIRGAGARVDLTPPRITGVIPPDVPPERQVNNPPPTITVQFNNDDLDPATVERASSYRLFSADGVDRSNEIRQLSYNEVDDAVVITLGELSESGFYTFVVRGDEEGIRDVTGNSLDGEANPQFPTGDGVAGGDFVTTLLLDFGPPRVVSITAGSPGSVLRSIYDSRNEDGNGNAQLDPGEDIDGDGVLDLGEAPAPPRFLTVTFDKPVNPATVNSDTVFLRRTRTLDQITRLVSISDDGEFDPFSDRVTGRVDLSADGRVMTFTPDIQYLDPDGDGIIEGLANDHYRFTLLGGGELTPEPSGTRENVNISCDDFRRADPANPLNPAGSTRIVIGSSIDCHSDNREVADLKTDYDPATTGADDVFNFPGFQGTTAVDLFLTDPPQDLAWFSLDGGLTWTQSTIPNVPGGSGAGDPSVVFDRLGNAYYAHLDGKGGVAVAKSIDRGASWRVNSIPLPEAAGPFGGSAAAAKPFLSIGPDIGNLGQDRIYVAYHADGVLFVNGSADGLTWTNPVRVSDVNDDGVNSQIGVAANGTVYATWQGFPGATPGESPIYFDASADGGQTWGVDSTIYRSNVVPVDDPLSTCDELRYCIPAAPDRGVGSFLSIDVDRSGGLNAGNIYITLVDQGDLDSNPFTGHDNTDVFVIRSSNGGATWSTPVRINDDGSGASQFLPWLDVDQTTGDIAVVWYDARDDAATNERVAVYASASFNGGQTFAANTRVSLGQSNQSESNKQKSRFNYGDYLGVSFDAGVAHVVWSDNSGLFGSTPANQELFTATVNISPGGITPGVNVNVSRDLFLEAEVTIAANPANPSNLIAASNILRGARSAPGDRAQIILTAAEDRGQEFNPFDDQIAVYVSQESGADGSWSKQAFFAALNEDVDGDGALDLVDTDGDGLFDLSEDIDLDGQIDAFAPSRTVMLEQPGGGFLPFQFDVAVKPSVTFDSQGNAYVAYALYDIPNIADFDLTLSTSFQPDAQIPAGKTASDVPDINDASATFNQSDYFFNIGFSDTVSPASELGKPRPLLGQLEIDVIRDGIPDFILDFNSEQLDSSVQTRFIRLTDGAGTTITDRVPIDFLGHRVNIRLSRNIISTLEQSVIPQPPGDPLGVVDFRVVIEAEGSQPNDPPVDVIPNVGQLVPGAFSPGFAPTVNLAFRSSAVVVSKAERLTNQSTVPPTVSGLKPFGGLLSAPVLVSLHLHEDRDGNGVLDLAAGDIDLDGDGDITDSLRVDLTPWITADKSPTLPDRLSTPNSNRDRVYVSFIESGVEQSGNLSDTRNLFVARTCQSGDPTTDVANTCETVYDIAGVSFPGYRFNSLEYLPPTAPETGAFPTGNRLPQFAPGLVTPGGTLASPRVATGRYGELFVLWEDYGSQGVSSVRFERSFDTFSPNVVSTDTFNINRGLDLPFNDPTGVITNVVPPGLPGAGTTVTSGGALPPPPTPFAQIDFIGSDWNGTDTLVTSQAVNGFNDPESNAFNPQIDSETRIPLCNTAEWPDFTPVDSRETCYSIDAQPGRGIMANASIAVDRSSGPFRGRIYIAYVGREDPQAPDRHDDTDIYVTFSDDSGVNWSTFTVPGGGPTQPGTQVNDDNDRASQFNPSISVDPITGDVYLAWYDTRNDEPDFIRGRPGNQSAELYFAVGRPETAGIAFLQNQVVSTQPSDQSLRNPLRNDLGFGDYTGIVGAGGLAHPVWTDTRTILADNTTTPVRQEAISEVFTATIDVSSAFAAPRQSPAITDVLGNALDGEALNVTDQSVGLPTGDGEPGGNLVAGFVISDNFIFADSSYQEDPIFQSTGSADRPFPTLERAIGDANSIEFTIVFGGPVTLPSALQADSIAGFIDLDVDQNSSTPLIDSNGDGRSDGDDNNLALSNRARLGTDPFGGLGVEFYVDLASEVRHPGTAELIDSRTRRSVGTVPLTLAASDAANPTVLNTLVVRVPRPLIKVGEFLPDFVDFAVVVGVDADNDGRLENERNEDANGNLICDPGEDLDRDGRFDIGELGIGFDATGRRVFRACGGPDPVAVGGFGVDLNGDGRLSLNEDLNGDGVVNINEDVDCDFVLDPGEDANGDGRLAPNEDLDCDGRFELFADHDGNGVADREIHDQAPNSFVAADRDHFVVPLPGEEAEEIGDSLRAGGLDLRAVIVDYVTNAPNVVRVRDGRTPGGQPIPYVVQPPPGELNGTILVGHMTDLVFDAGSVVKLRAANLDVAGTGAGVFSLGTSLRPVIFTSVFDDTLETGGDTNGDDTNTVPRGGDWGGLVFRSGTDDALALVNFTNIRYGGGVVPRGGVGGLDTDIRPESITLKGSRPTIVNSKFENNGNSLTEFFENAQAAISATPDSFADDTSLPADGTGAGQRGPLLRNIDFLANSIDGLLVHASHDTGEAAYTSFTEARWDDTEIVHVLTTLMRVSLGTSLAIDPGTVVKSRLGAIQVDGRGSLIAGSSTTSSSPVIFTSIFDDSDGRDTTNDLAATQPNPGDWGSIFTLPPPERLNLAVAGPGLEQRVLGGGPTLIIDEAVISYGGGAYVDNAVPSLGFGILPGNVGGAIRHSGATCLTTLAGCKPRSALQLETPGYYQVTDVEFENNGLTGNGIQDAPFTVFAKVLRADIPFDLPTTLVNEAALNEDPLIRGNTFSNQSGELNSMEVVPIHSLLTPDPFFESSAIAQPAAAHLLNVEFVDIDGDGRLELSDGIDGYWNDSDVVHVVRDTVGLPGRIEVPNAANFGVTEVNDSQEFRDRILIAGRVDPQDIREIDFETDPFGTPLSNNRVIPRGLFNVSPFSVQINPLPGAGEPQIQGLATDQDLIRQIDDADADSVCNNATFVELPLRPTSGANLLGATGTDFTADAFQLIFGQDVFAFGFQVIGNNFPGPGERIEVDIEDPNGVVATHTTGLPVTAPDAATFVGFISVFPIREVRIFEADNSEDNCTPFLEFDDAGYDDFVFSVVEVAPFVRTATQPSAALTIQSQPAGTVLRTPFNVPFLRLEEPEPLVVKLSGTAPAADLFGADAFGGHAALNRAFIGAGFQVGMDDGNDNQVNSTVCFDHGSHANCQSNGTTDWGLGASLRLLGVPGDEATGQSRVPVVITSLFDDAEGPRGEPQNTDGLNSLNLAAPLTGQANAPSAGNWGDIFIGARSAGDRDDLLVTDLLGKLVRDAQAVPGRSVTPDDPTTEFREDLLPTVLDETQGSVILDALIKYGAKIRHQGASLISNPANPAAFGQEARNGTVTSPQGESVDPTACTPASCVASNGSMVIAHNEILNMRDAGVIAHPGFQTVADDAHDDFTWVPAEPWIYNNVIASITQLNGAAGARTGYGVRVQGADDGEPVHCEFFQSGGTGEGTSAVVMHNTIFGTTRGIQLGDDGGSIAINNLISDVTDGLRMEDPDGCGARWQAGFNLFYNVPGIRLGLNNIDGNLGFGGGTTLFQDPTRGDFRLLTFSQSEDTNGNGVLDPGEDRDGDNFLDLGGVPNPAIDTAIGEYAPGSQWARAIDDEIIRLPLPITVFNTSPLGPEKDLFGVVRQDDVRVANSPPAIGVGAEVFFDIGALESRDIGAPFVEDAVMELSASTIQLVPRSANLPLVSEIPSKFLIGINEDLDAGTLTKLSILLTPAGGDGQIQGNETPVDILIGCGLDDTVGTPFTVCITPAVPLAEDLYRLTLRATLITDVDGVRLDGEFPGRNVNTSPLTGYPTGDGQPGGDFVTEFQIGRPPQVESIRVVDGRSAVLPTPTLGPPRGVDADFFPDESEFKIENPPTLIEVKFTRPVTVPDANTFQVSAYGPDGQFDTADDQIVSGQVSAIVNGQLVLPGSQASDTWMFEPAIQGTLPTNSVWRVLLDGTSSTVGVLPVPDAIANTSGIVLDGNFISGNEDANRNGSLDAGEDRNGNELLDAGPDILPSGDEVAGGDFVGYFQVGEIRPSATDAIFVDANFMAAEGNCPLDSNGDPVEVGIEACPFDTILEALDAALLPDAPTTIKVKPGRYREHVEMSSVTALRVPGGRGFTGITLESTEGDSNTIIEVQPGMIDVFNRPVTAAVTIEGFSGITVAGFQIVSDGLIGVSVDVSTLKSGGVANLIGRNTIYGNQTGVFLLLGGGEGPRVENNVIWANSGTGLEIKGKPGNDDADIVNNTIVFNNEGVRLSNIGLGIPRLANIFNNIIVGSNGSGIVSTRTATAEIDFNDVFQNLGGNYTNVSVSGTHNIAEDPLFVRQAPRPASGRPNPSEADWHLRSFSPAIDRGLGSEDLNLDGQLFCGPDLVCGTDDPGDEDFLIKNFDLDAASPTDHDGNPRIDDADVPNRGLPTGNDFVDLGAFERQFDSSDSQNSGPIGRRSAVSSRIVEHAVDLIIADTDYQLASEQKSANSPRNEDWLEALDELLDRAGSRRLRGRRE
jgi:hypothetical protein